MKDTLFAIGEALIDFIPAENGCGFSQVSAFSPKLGGAPANVLGAFAKLGGKTQLITQLGNDPFGHKIADELKEYNIGIDHLSFTDEANTALAFVSLDASGDRTFSFYRSPSADMLFDGESLSESDFADCFALHFCSVSLGDFPMKAAHKRAVAFAKSSGAIISFDPNIRLPLWKDLSLLKSSLDEFLPLADIIKISDNELEIVADTDDIDKGCSKLSEYAKIVICTCGGNGAYAYAGGKKIFSPSARVEVKDTTGAGDAFNGSFLYSLYKNGFTGENLSSVTEEQLREFLDASNAYCGKSVCAYGAIASYPNSL